jgi:hypothetical protein
MVDTTIDTPHGPHPIQKSGSVTVPVDLQIAIGLEKGQKVFWILNPDMPGTLVLIPASIMSRAMPGLVEDLRTLGS